MRLSRLQKYILEKCSSNKSGAELKTAFYNFYPAKKFKKNKKNVQDIIHKSLESMVGKDLIVAFGRQTAKKWFIYKVKLTKPGRRLVKEIIKSRQRRLPIK